MFNLTQNIKLDRNHQQIYLKAKILLYIFFMIGALLTVHKILFPSQTLALYFENINAAKNTLVNPRNDSNQIPSKGILQEKETFTFNANPFGNFSSAEVTFLMDEKNDLENSNVQARKSYQAFFYPEGKPVGFKSGSLLTTQDGNYYIVSGGLVRRFGSTEIILNFGFPKSAFLLVDPQELSLNQTGPDISSSVTYPEDSLFLIDEKFYQLKDGRLMPFISSRAFLSEFDQSQAIGKSKEIFSQYPPSENAIGFSNGTLASSADSAFILSQGKSYPIADFNTFEAMGFSWDNVVKLESDELGSYEQQKQFTLHQPHPDGTIFQDENNKYYLIEKNLKRPITSDNVLATYGSKNAIKVDSLALFEKSQCVLEKNLLSKSRWSCEIPLEKISQIIGNDYEFQADFIKQTKIKEVSVTFSTPITWKNMLNSLSKIKGNLKNNYSAQ